MIPEVELTEDEKEHLFLEWAKRPVLLNAKRAKHLIEELEDVIIDLRAKLKDASRLEKNMIYNQILNKQTQIKHANTFL